MLLLVLLIKLEKFLSMLAQGLIIIIWKLYCKFKIFKIPTYEELQVCFISSGQEHFNGEES